jgi:hypothetical protein
MLIFNKLKKKLNSTPRYINSIVSKASKILLVMQRRPLLSAIASD